jgi:YjjW family glycine radical enzyme activase
MAAAVGFVNRILSHSFVDGPGNRAVVFLQGCNMRCLYCHNPYTLSLCNHCGDCVPACPTGALEMVDGRVVWHTALCDECDDCIRACTHHSTPRARAMTAVELWGEIAPLAPFLSGVTVSGGEPLLQLDFLVDFFTLVKRESRLTTLVETNGCVPAEALHALLPVLDAAMIDLKAMGTAQHITLTGQPPDLTRQSIRLLAAHGKVHAVRQVVAPGFTDGVEGARATARFVAQIDPSIPLRFLRFRPHGASGEAQAWESPSDEVMDRLVAAAREVGLNQVSRSL